jgi:hypothetical protein
MERQQFELLLGKLTEVVRVLQRLAYATETLCTSTVLSPFPCHQCGSYLVDPSRLCGACGAMMKIVDERAEPQ